MKARICCSVAAASVFAVGMIVHAQAQSTPSEPATSPSGARAGGGAARTMTVTGCLERDTSVGASNPSSDGMFKLTNVQPASMSGANSSATAGVSPAGAVSTDATAGRRGRGAMASEYHLTPAAGVDLSQHLNHKVEVTGTVAGGGRNRAAAGSSNSGAMNSAGTSSPMGSSGSTGSSASSAGAGAQGGAMAQTVMTPSFNVTALTMLSSSCQ